MRFRRPSLITRIAVPLRGAAQRFALGSLVVASFMLMFLGKTDTQFVERFRTSVTDLATPILEVMAEPVAAFDKALDYLGELAALHEENRRLREEVARLREWHSAALRLKAENNSFRKLLNYTGPDRRSFVSARVIADGRGPFVKSVLVNAGTRDGVVKGQATMTQLGLVGRVTEVGERSARVLMITDLNSRIPVLIQETRARAILAGDNSDHPELVFLPERAKVTPGQRVVTSGDGGALPPGIPVGVVSAVGPRAIRVRPFVDWDRLEYVQIVDFDRTTDPVSAVPDNPAAADISTEKELR